MMNTNTRTKRMLSLLLALVMVFSMLPVSAFAASADATLTASLAEAKSYIDGITINNSSNDPATVVKNFKTHFTWDNEKRENSKSYLFDWSYYNGVVFEGIEYVYEVTGESVYKDYVVEYMSSLITSSGGWATCSNNSSKQCAGYNASHGADCYKTASLLLDTYEMTGDSRYLTMAATLYADLDSAANSYSLKNAGNNYRHTWASDPSPDLWLDGLYMILPFRAEYAKYIGDTEELDLIVSRMQWVSDNMYNSSKGLFYHAADSASSNSGTYWLRSIGWYAAAIVDIMDHMEGSNLEAMKVQLKKLVDGMKACQNSSNGMWLNNMNASQSSSNPYETSGTALTCYAVLKAVNKGWLNESYADMAILAFNGICNEKLSGSTLTDICFKGAPGSSNSTFYDNEGKGVGPFIMFYAEMLKYVNTEDVPEETEPEETEPEATEPEATEPEATEPEDPEQTVYQGTGSLEGNAVYTLDSDGVNSGEKYLIVYSGRALQNSNGVDNNPTVTISNNQITLSDDSQYAWTITQSGSNYYVENNGSYLNLTSSGNDPIGSSATVSISRSGSTYKFRNTSSSGAYLRYSNSQLFCAGTSGSNNSMSLYRRTTGTGEAVVFTVNGIGTLKVGESSALNSAVTVGGESVSLNNCTISWASSNSSVAAVSGGTVTGVAAGNANITATLTAVNGTALKQAIVLTIPVTVQGHTYEAVVTAPTCTEQGYTTYTCTVCGDSYVADYTDALGHNYESVTVDPTCTEEGSITYTCTCGDTYVEVIKAIGHDYEAVVTAPTCTAAGYTTHTCANCGDSYVANEVAATGHDYETVTAAPTCTEGGYTAYTCVNCGDSHVTDETAALGHAYTSVTVEATCETPGHTTHTCQRCEDSYISNEVAALGHDLLSVDTAPTCTTDGYTTHTCQRCDEVTVDSPVAALGHDWVTVTVEATCETAGHTNASCRNCGEETMEVIPALGHNYNAVVTAPTCTEGGYTTHTCGNCGDSYTSDNTAALGHAYSSETVEATCTTDGSIIYTCRCGDSYVDVIQATGHDYTAVVTAPTCENVGFTTYTCTVCGNSYIDDEIAALGHTYEAVVTAPTCTEDGCTTHTCAACGDSYISDYSEAYGHSYTTEEVDGTLVHTCEICGDTFTEITNWIKLDNVYVLDTNGINIGEEHKYIVVGGNQDYALTLSGTTIGASEVTIEDNTIILPDSSEYEFYFVNNSSIENGTYLLTQDGSKTVYHANGYIYYGTDNKGYWYIGSGSNGAYQLFDYDNNNWYLNYGYVWVNESVSRFAVSSNARSVRLFKVAESYARLAGSMNQSYTEACGTALVTEADILDKLTIQLSENGSIASSSIAVTADMITWDKALDGNIAGTYTATVTYQGNVLGTVTVNVTGAHDYVTSVVAPTCTEQGYTIHCCTKCGGSHYTDYTAALGHSYSCVESNGYMVYTCNQCGHSYSEELTATYTQVSALSSGNKYVITLKSGNMYYALSHANNSISVVQVTVSNGEITSEISEDLLWTYSKNKLSYVSNGTTYYMYQYGNSWGNWWGSSTATLRLSNTSSSTVSFSSNKLKVGSYYLRYSNGSISLSNNSATAAYCFVEE